MLKIKDIIEYLENFAPLAYQESYDNAGLLVGDKSNALQGVLICLDSTEDVVEEAIARQCNLIVAHHPIIFSGLKKISGTNYIERTVLKAIKNDVAIYACHTNLDHMLYGVNRKIAEKLLLHNLRVLVPKTDTLQKLTTFVPAAHEEAVRAALHAAGAGSIGNYSNCSFSSTGTGRFEPKTGANPHIGEVDRIEEVLETRLEVVCPAHLTSSIIGALLQAHPYEEVAYYLQHTSNANQDIGAGMIGTLDKPLTPTDFLHFLKRQMGLKVIRHTTLPDSEVRTIALCGGSGQFLLKEAIRANADVFVSADFKYHQFFDADDKIIIADIGHYESEVFTKELIYEILNKKFRNIALNLSEIVTNPIRYL